MLLRKIKKTKHKKKQGGRRFELTVVQGPSLYWIGFDSKAAWKRFLRRTGYEEVQKE